ncbi:putative C6 transcription factor [Aspergillus ambiguus]|uniref:putative C6 transcription factor n=1 Tax=Aspergillus ambiguus TaxID=176160 RepID=UPI003CCDF6E7
MYPSPTSAEKLEDDSSRPRQRTSRACDSCYKRKIKCDAAVPQCNWCSHHNIPCTFTRVTRRRRKEKTETPPQRTSHLAERIDRIEKLLTDNLLRDSSPRLSSHNSPIPTGDRFSLPVNSPPLDQSSVSSSVPLHFAGRELGPVSLITGIPFLSPSGRQWVQARTGQQITFDKLSPTRPPWEKQRAQSSNSLLMNLQSQNMFDLPDRNVVELHFQLYRYSIMQRIFPVVDGALFQETIRTAYEQANVHQPGQSSMRACIFSFLAFASFMRHPSHHPERKHINAPPIDGEEFVLKAQHFIPQLLQETTTLDSLQAVTMLALYELVSGNLQSASYYGSISTSMIFTLGAHTSTFQSSAFAQSSEDIKQPVHGHLRNLFWLSYTIEKDICLRTGQPQLFSEENCDLTLPAGYVEKLYTSMEYHHHSQELPTTPIFPVDLRLSIIKSRAYSALYSFKALQKTDAELLKEIRELDDELEKWRMSVPLEWRPTLSFSHETPDPNVSMHSVMLRLNYHLCMTIIHMASSRCKSWANGQAGMMDGVSSSLALSVEASRSTLLYLEAAEHVLVDGIFWTVIFYPMSALMAIFCNILQNPSDPQATKDLGLLKTATGMVERVFLRQSFSVVEIVHIKLVANFVTELYRLAGCAVEKAWNERHR